MSGEYHAIGNEVYDKRGCHILGINYAPHGELPKMAAHVARLLNMEHAMRNRPEVQGIERERHSFDVV